MSLRGSPREPIEAISDIMMTCEKIPKVAMKTALAISPAGSLLLGRRIVSGYYLGRAD